MHVKTVLLKITLSRKITSVAYIIQHMFYGDWVVFDTRITYNTHASYKLWIRIFKECTRTPRPSIIYYDDAFKDGLENAFSRVLSRKRCSYRTTYAQQTTTETIIIVAAAHSGTRNTNLVGHNLLKNLF